MRTVGNGNYSASSGMRTLLICHDGAHLDQIALARWLASFSQLAGVVVLRETKKRGWRRIRREIRRVGMLRFLDVLAFRLYYKLFVAASDREWEKNTLRELSAKYSQIEVPTLMANSPNSPEVESFIKQLSPDFVIARCKTLLKESVFSIPSKGTFVMHPGICPEYRNAHGCFWALANNDRDRVGMTLLRIDRGVDTGPIYGYYSYPFDEATESHVVIQNRVVTENLVQLESKFRDIYNSVAVPMEVVGRSSSTWGQPWLTKQIELKKRAKQRKQ
jgi:folate-dependent phosphoribosylglycinamide formyltransferase PurN